MCKILRVKKYHLISFFENLEEIDQKNPVEIFSTENKK